jgi:ribosomal protein L22
MSPAPKRKPSEEEPAVQEKAKPARRRSAKADAAGSPLSSESAEKSPVSSESAEKSPVSSESAEKSPAKAKTKDAASPVTVPSRAARTRRSSGAGGDAPGRIVRAHARHVRTSARKARLVCDHLRGLSVTEARAILAFTPRAVARDWSKLLESAVANAENNHELLQDDLYVREAYADEGPTIKRSRPRAMGRATPIRKRTSHLTITLQTKSQARPQKKTRAKSQKPKS